MKIIRNLAVIAILVLSMFNYAGCAPAPKPVPKTHILTYEVAGSAWTVSVTYLNTQGGTEQVSDVRLPWSKTFSNWSFGLAAITAQNTSRISVMGQDRLQSGSVTVTIYLDGKVFRRSTSSGAGVIASAEGLVN